MPTDIATVRTQAPLGYAAITRGAGGMIPPRVFRMRLSLADRFTEDE
jgi:hypothetical protein